MPFWVQQPAIIMLTMQFDQRFTEVSSHIVGLDTPGEVLELHHASRSARPYAEGALVAAAFVHGKKGVFTMNDVANETLAPLFEDIQP